MPTENPELELTVTFININYGHNKELMDKCKTLSGYSLLIQRVREYSAVMSLEEAADKAVNECIEENILVEVLDKCRREAGQMILYEFDEEKYKRALYNHGHEDGMANSIHNLMSNMSWTLDQAMDALGIPTEERSKYRKILSV